MTELMICELEPHDASSIIPLINQVQRIHAERLPETFRENIPAAELEAFLRNWLSRENVTALLATGSKGKPVGYLIFEIQAKEPGTFKKPNTTCFLHHIAVDEHHRRQGVGTALIDEMKQRAQQNRAVSIVSEYYAFNHASSALMKSAGLEPVSIVVESKIDASG